MIYDENGCCIDIYYLHYFDHHFFLDTKSVCFYHYYILATHIFLVPSWQCFMITNDYPCMILVYYLQSCEPIPFLVNCQAIFIVTNLDSKPGAFFKYISERWAACFVIIHSMMNTKRE